MPTFIFDHQTCREKTCVLCFKKGKSKITERVKDMIESVALPHYRNYCDSPTLPKVICDTCRNKLVKRQNGKNVTITVPILSKFLEDRIFSGPISVSQFVLVCDLIPNVYIKRGSFTAILWPCYGHFTSRLSQSVTMHHRHRVSYCISHI